VAPCKTMPSTGSLTLRSVYQAQWELTTLYVVSWHPVGTRITVSETARII
jgi:hypothetical protein